jgi:Cys-rich protein (TIGR01571 family)
MNYWKHSMLDCNNTENVAMAVFCYPCLYGINKSKLDSLDGQPNPSMIPGTCAYIAMNIGWQLMGIMYTGFVAQLFGVAPAPEIVQSVSGLCGMIGTGLYAGRLRTRLREKYSISGTQCNDCVVHGMVSPCALCQEANEIHYQSNNTFAFYSPMDVPATETMKA